MCKDLNHWFTVTIFIEWHTTCGYITVAVITNPSVTTGFPQFLAAHTIWTQFPVLPQSTETD